MATKIEDDDAQNKSNKRTTKQIELAEKYVQEQDILLAQSESERLVELVNELKPQIKRLRINTDDLDDLSEVLSMLPLRGLALSEAAERLIKLEGQGIELTQEQLFAIASTDLFVEKAQHVLTRRSKRLYYAGTATIIATFLLLLGSAIFIIWQIATGVPDEIRFPEVHQGSYTIHTNSTHALILRIFQATALSAFVLVGVKYLIGLGRSFFHEAESLRQRRHALRFGRLYVYLRKGNIELDKLQEAFQWNKEVHTSFLDMKPEVITETVIQRLIDAATKSPAESVKAITDALVSITGKVKKEK